MVSELTMSLIPGELTDPILSGEIPVQGDAAWAITAGASVDRNSRKMLEGAFDVAEMSFATFLKAREQGRDLIGLPIFTGRGFLQPGLIVSEAAGITRPEDLAAKRVAVPQFWMTSSVWHRGILVQQHGVSAETIRWFTAVEERFENIVYPPGIRVERLPDGVDVNEALTRGLVDAMLIPPRGVPRTLTAPMRPGYPDIAAAQHGYFERTGVFPIMHFVVMRASLPTLPRLVPALIDVFAQAQRRIGDRAGVPAPIGLEANRRAVEAFFDFAREQGWVSGLDAAGCFVTASG
jgi:4,5-dihydroxyphthalate decarboxylase